MFLSSVLFVPLTKHERTTNKATLRRGGGESQSKKTFCNQNLNKTNPRTKCRNHSCSNTTVYFQVFHGVRTGTRHLVHSGKNCAPRSSACPIAGMSRIRNVLGDYFSLFAFASWLRLIWHTFRVAETANDRRECVYERERDREIERERESCLLQPLTMLAAESVDTVGGESILMTTFWS